MKPIGGYFEWEVLREDRGGPHPYSGHRLKSGRSCIRLLVETEKPARVLLPYYVCDAATEPLLATGTRIEYLAISPDLELADALPDLGPGDRILWVNYFGLKADYSSFLATRYGAALWLDDTQAFFHSSEGTRSFVFNSARKFFGVPDGAYLYAPDSIALPPIDAFDRNLSYRADHLLLRHQGRIAEGLEIFRENERLCGGEVARMSALSELLMERVDLEAAAARRRENYQTLDARLASANQLPRSLTKLDADSVPMCYPYLPPRPLSAEHLWRHHIFAPVLWRECLNRLNHGFEWERRLSRELLPLPIDHRYRSVEMIRILEALESYAG